MAETDQNHEAWMRRALELARRGEGLTRPNPPVGAVLVRKGEMVGEGFHRQAGGPHAEIGALDAASEKARGATLYVTLEPCSTWGRTPPCVDAILKNGIRQVVVGARDPNPRHAGRGLALLRRRGVEVVEGICAEEAAGLVRPFAKWIATGRPWVTLKLGVSLDGKIADRAGASRWITGPESRRRVHDLRRRVDAILVGVGTAISDDPLLVPNPSEGRAPLRVVADSRGRIPLRCRLLNDEHVTRTVVATTRGCVPAMQEKLQDKGAQVLVLPGPGGRVSLGRLLVRLGKRGALHVLCEGGGEMAAAMLRAKLVDEVWMFVAPCVIGGREAVPAFGGFGWSLSGAPKLKFISFERVGDDVLIRGRPV